MIAANLQKLTRLSASGIKTEAELVYFLVVARKVLDGGGKQVEAKVKRYVVTDENGESTMEEHETPYSPGPDWLRFYCDWAVHATLQQGQARAALEVVAQAIPFLVRRAGGQRDDELPRAFLDLVTLKGLESEVVRFCQQFRLPQFDRVGLFTFTRLFCQVVADCPLALHADNAGVKAVSRISCRVERSWDASGSRFFASIWHFELYDGKTGDFQSISEVRDDELLSSEGELWPLRQSEGARSAGGVRLNS
jgi:hypothetical protein